MLPLHRLILGGQKSGKSRLAEQHAAAWLAASPGHRATLVATAEAGDDEMAARIRRHRSDRAARLPGLATLEVPTDLASALQLHSAPDHLLVVDCVTLWLTQLLLPLRGQGLDDAALAGAISRLLAALRQAPGPVLWVSNEIGLGVSPIGPDVRRFLDTLGLLHQQIAALCGQVQWMVAGIPVTVKGPA